MTSTMPPSTFVAVEARGDGPQKSVALLDGNDDGGVSQLFEL